MTSGDEKGLPAVVTLTAAEKADLFNAACRAHSGPPTFVCRPCADAQDMVIERVISARLAEITPPPVHSRAPRWLRPYLPNTSTRLALVSLDRPDAAHWPLRLTQIVGGRAWSLSLVRYRTPTPVLTTRPLPPDDGREASA